MTRTVTIVDYGIGNVRSVMNAFQFFGIGTLLSDNPDHIENADYLVLPGVGAFGNGMEELAKRNLVAPIVRYAEKERPFLGICLGMQMMFEDSEEFGQHDGLGLIKGHVKKIPTKMEDGTSAKIPHIGWAQINPGEQSPSWEHGLLKEIPTGSYMYFVHSYQAHVDEPTEGLAYSHYHGHPILGTVSKGHLHGCQFHPEKSSEVGLKIIKQFTDS